MPVPLAVFVPTEKGHVVCLDLSIVMGERSFEREVRGWRFTRKEEAVVEMNSIYFPPFSK
jgi:hypothetical protein